MDGDGVCGGATKCFIWCIIISICVVLLFSEDEFYGRCILMCSQCSQCFFKNKEKMQNKIKKRRKKTLCINCKSLQCYWRVRQACKAHSIRRSRIIYLTGLFIREICKLWYVWLFVNCVAFYVLTSQFVIILSKSTETPIKMFRFRCIQNDVMWHHGNDKTRHFPRLRLERFQN